MKLKVYNSFDSLIFEKNPANSHFLERLYFYLFVYSLGYQHISLCFSESSIHDLVTREVWEILEKSNYI